MASVISDPKGRKRIQFVAGDGSRKTVRLGKATLRQAESIKPKVEQLILAATGITGVIDDETTKWLTGLDEAMYDKLAAVGLVAPRTSTTLGAFIDAYISERHDVKKGTRTVYEHTKRNLIAFFDKDKPLRDITEDDADKWRLFLIEQGLSENTVRLRSAIAKQFFKTALGRKLVNLNPFADLKVAVKAMLRNSTSSQLKRLRKYLMLVLNAMVADLRSESLWGPAISIRALSFDLG